MRDKARFVIGGLAAAAGLLVAGRLAFARRVSRDVDALLRQNTGRQPLIVSERDLTRVPEPAARWLRAANVVGSAIPRVVSLRQEGRIRLRPNGIWLPFTARQIYTTDPPGFVWAADVRVAPFLSVQVLDCSVAGHGATEPWLLGLIPLPRASGPEIDAGSLQRYLNEIMWFPAAALSASIRWAPIDARSARATIHDHEQRVSGVFVWDDSGRLVTMSADRFRTVDGHYLLTPWETPILDYGEFAGVRVPVAGEGVWHLDTGDFTYITLRVTDIAYE